MVHTLFDINAPNYEDFFNTQTGGGYFEGLRYQRGRGQRGQGAGKVLSSIWRFLQPKLKSAGKALGKEGIDTGLRAVSAIAMGEKTKDVLKREAKEGARHLLRKASEKLVQKGSGPRRKRKRSLVGRRFTKKPRADALGSY